MVARGGFGKASVLAPGNRGGAFAMDAPSKGAGRSKCSEGTAATHGGITAGVGTMRCCVTPSAAIEGAGRAVVGAGRAVSAALGAWLLELEGCAMFAVDVIGVG